MLTEWKRVLKPGGKLILELPCLNKVFAYITRTVNAQQPLAMHMVWLPFWGEFRTKVPEMTHKWGYTKESIGDLLREVGFVDVTYEKPRYHFPERDMRVTAVKP